MPKLLMLGLIGLFAQLTAGSLGMGYGVITTSALLGVGLTPALASATVHFAELGTSAALGASHWRLRNVDWQLVARLAGPGAVGAFGGAVLLTRLPVTLSSIVMATILVAIGCYVVLRFSLRPPLVAHARRSPHTARLLTPLGLFGGFLDATGGGGWGPVTTTALLSAGRTAPRTVIGSVDASKFVVSAAASLGFVLALGIHQVPLTYVLTLMGAGLVAAPVAAWLASRVPATVLGTAAGGLVIAVNARVLLIAAGLPAQGWIAAYALVGVLWALFVAVSVKRYRATSVSVAGPIEGLATS